MLQNADWETINGFLENPLESLRWGLYWLAIRLKFRREYNETHGMVPTHLDRLFKVVETAGYRYKPE